MAYSALKRVPASRRGGMKQPRHKPFLAPVKGWVSATNLAAAPDGAALVLENWYPTTTGIKMRRGSTKHGTAHATDPLESLMAYIGASTREMFGAAAGNILDLTAPADADVVPTPEVTGQTSDYYSHANFANAGGNYMHCANGTDPILVYDGTNFMPVFDTELYALNYDAETVAFTAGQTLPGTLVSSSRSSTRALREHSGCGPRPALFRTTRSSRALPAPPLPMASDPRFSRPLPALPPMKSTM
jgi:hypothetical protein